MADGAKTSHPDWSLSEERQFVENLFCQRFNFFIVIFSLVMVGAASANTQTKFVILLWVGCALCGLVALTIYRNWLKLDWILKQLHKADGHPVAVTGVGVENHPYPKLFGVNPIIGIVIPLGSTSLLLVGAICASTGLLRAF
jgi:hypothetical protein